MPKGVKKLIYMQSDLIEDGKRLAESAGHNNFSSYLSELVKKDRDDQAMKKINAIIDDLNT